MTTNWKRTAKRLAMELGKQECPRTDHQVEWSRCKNCIVEKVWSMDGNQVKAAHCWLIWLRVMKKRRR